MVGSISSAGSVSFWCKRNVVVSDEDWLRIQTMFTQDVVIRLDRLTMHQGRCGWNATRL